MRSSWRLITLTWSWPQWTADQPAGMNSRAPETQKVPGPDCQNATSVRNGHRRFRGRCCGRGEESPSYPSTLARPPRQGSQQLQRHPARIAAHVCKRAACGQAQHRAKGRVETAMPRMKKEQSISTTGVLFDAMSWPTSRAAAASVAVYLLSLIRCWPPIGVRGRRVKTG